MERPTPERREQLDEIRRLGDAVRRVGVNVNQITRRVNLAPYHIAALLAEEEVLAELAKTGDVLREVLAVLEDLRPVLRGKSSR